MDADRVAQRALDLHDKASMPLAEAVALALNEAAPGPIWPCAKLVIKDGQVSLLSHQYAPGLPDGEHDVYPLPVNSDAEPTAGAASLVGLREGDGLVSGVGDVHQRVSVPATGADEVVAALVNLRRDGPEHDGESAASAGPHGRDGTPGDALPPLAGQKERDRQHD